VHVLEMGGVALTIVPLLSLGADQTKKLKELSSVNNCIIESIHLDEYRDESDQKQIRKFLASTTENTSQTIYIFSSPQAITKSEIYQAIIATIYNLSLLMRSIYLCTLVSLSVQNFRSYVPCYLIKFVVEVAMHVGYSTK
jgi:hypothetical protein